MVIQVQLGSVIFAPGHFKSCELRALYLPKTSYKTELKQCRRLIVFNLPRHIDCVFGHHLTLNSRVLSSYSDLDLLRSTKIYFDEYRRNKHNGVRIIVPTFFVQKLFMKKYVDALSRWPDLRGQQLTV